MDEEPSAQAPDRFRDRKRRGADTFDRHTRSAELFGEGTDGFEAENMRRAASRSATRQVDNNCLETSDRQAQDDVDHPYWLRVV